MFDLTTWPDTPSAISLPVSADGHSPSETLGGPTIDQSGREVARVSLSPRQAEERGLLTSGTYGPTSTTSSASAALASSLVSRLKQQLTTAGSTLFNLTWKEKATPSGRSVCLLRASALRTSGSDCGGLPKRATGEGRHGSNLDDFVMLTHWPSPTVGNATGSQAAKDASSTGRRPDGSKATVSLNAVSRMAGWPTPCSQDGPNGGPDQGIDRLPGAASLVSPWATPTTRDWKAGSAIQNFKPRTCQLNDQVLITEPARLTVFGEMLTGSSAGMESGGQLNPEHSRWLMGFPPAWESCAPTVMPSSRKLRKPLSAPTSAEIDIFA